MLATIGGPVSIRDLPDFGGFAKEQHAIEWSFIVLQIFGGQICLPLLLLTYLCLGSKGTNKSRTLKRSPIVINFIITWIISSICYSLLLYTERSDPLLQALNITNLSLCLVQASLIPASQALTASATLVVVLNVLRAVVRESSRWKPINRKLKNCAMAFFLLVPYIIFLAFFIQAYIVGSHSITVNVETDPRAPPLLVGVENLSFSNTLYCVIARPEVPDPGKFSQIAVPILPPGYVFSIILTGFTLFIEGSIIWTIYRRRHDQVLNEVYRTLLVRVTCFSAYRVIALGLLIGDVTPLVLQNSLALTALGGTFKVNTQLIVDLFLATGPLIAFLVMSTRADVLIAWGIKKHKSSIEVIPDRTGHLGGENSSHPSQIIEPQA